MKMIEGTFTKIRDSRRSHGYELYTILVFKSYPKIIFPLKNDFILPIIQELSPF